LSDIRERNLLRNRKRRDRDKARKKVPELLIKQEGKCYYCGREIICIASILNNNIVHINNGKGTVLYTSNGEDILAYYATVEHKVRMIDGGKNDEENIVASCYKCNIRKNKEIQEGKPYSSYCKLCKKIKDNGFRNSKWCKACHPNSRFFIRGGLFKCIIEGNDYY
jgi:5-methylcytosine-specific restriction endonuclease McrA